MKLEHELLKSILTWVREYESIPLESKPGTVLGEHVRLLYETGLLYGIDLDNFDRGLLLSCATLTRDGWLFLCWGSDGHRWRFAKAMLDLADCANAREPLRQLISWIRTAWLDAWLVDADECERTENRWLRLDSA